MVAESSRLRFVSAGLMRPLSPVGWFRRVSPISTDPAKPVKAC